MFRSGPRRGKLRTKVVAGVVAITLVVLAVFDFAAVTALRKYLISQTDMTLKSALTFTRPRLTALLPAFRPVALPVVGAGQGPGRVPVKGRVAGPVRHLAAPDSADAPVPPPLTILKSI